MTALWRTTTLTTGQLLAVAACGLIVAAGAGARGANTAAKGASAAQQAADAVHQEHLAQITTAAAALDKLIHFNTTELLQGGTPAIPEVSPELVGVSPAARLVQHLGDLQVHVAEALERVHSESQSQVTLDMLSQFAEREHALVERILGHLDTVQAKTDDPDQLDILWKLDHLVTRLRRWVESKSAAAGQSLRSAEKPVTVVQVLRGAVQEVEHYQRVTIAAGTVGVDLGLPRHVGPDVTHLLAELVDNATVYCDRQFNVEVRAMQVATGLTVEIEDRATIPMAATVRTELNLLLSDPDRVNVRGYVKHGKIGVLTAAKIARVHGIAVQLTENPMGGTTAVVTVPRRLLVPMQAQTAPARVSAPAGTPPVPRHLPRRMPVQPVADAASAAAFQGGADVPPPLPRRMAEATPEAPPKRVHRPRSMPDFSLAGDIDEGFEAARAAQARPGPPTSRS
ncbi:ATP-binding protein [Streptomyces sp. NPDC006335]|uniref:ATP-binding protein n=1 Tax=Streptomyces sp. NPDC006335 TaxID=3156895 RepID=UPI0033B76136